MKRSVSLLFIFAWLLLIIPASAENFSGKTGVSTLEWTFGKTKVTADFDMQKVKRGDFAFPEGLVDAPNYAVDRPVLMLKSLRISVNGRKLFVPPSVWHGLYDLNRAEVIQSKDGTFALSIEGGDGGYGWNINISFNRARVWRKEVFSIPFDYPVETTYYR